MNILLTNDDGYDSEGIRLLYKKLAKYGEVTIVAPKTQQSAKSASITINKGIEATKVDERIFSFDGTPADCVAFGLSSLDKKFDLVVSGCNYGLNISFDCVFSGTIGACIQSLIMKTPCVAFSAPWDFSLVEKEFDKVMQYILDNNLLSSDKCLNVNFPYGDEIKDIKICKEHFRNTRFYFEKKEDGYYPYREHLDDEDKIDKNTDCYALRHGVVSIVKLNKTYYY